MVKIKTSVFMILLFSMLFCAEEEPGMFAFFPAEMSELDSLGKNHYRPKWFKKYRSGTSFPSDKTLWFTWKPSAPDTTLPYAISLSRKSLGFNEIDLRNSTIRPGVGAIVDYYENLEPGQYLLRVAYKNTVQDSVYFDIVSTVGPGLVDYETPVEIPFESLTSETEYDDIREYSR